MEVIDRIYEAALIQETWRDTIAEMARISGASEGAMLLFHQGGPLRAVEYNLPPGQMAQFANIWKSSPSVRWALANCPPSFTRFADNLPLEKLDADPSKWMLYDRGIVDELIAVHPLDETRTLGFIFSRNQRAGAYNADEIAALNALRPHLVRAGTVAARMELERAQAMAAALEQFGLAAAVINRAGRVIASNSLLEATSDLFVPTAFGGIALSHRGRNAQLLEMLSRVGSGADGPAASLPIPGTDEHSPMIVHLLPVRGLANDVFVGGHVVMVVSPVVRQKAVAPHILRVRLENQG